MATPTPSFPPPGGINELPYTETAMEQSIQGRAHLAPETDLVTAALWFAPRYPDGVVPGWPSMRRDEALRAFWMQEGNDILQGALTGVVSRVATLDWHITGGVKGVEYFQDILQNAELGLGWGTFAAKVLQDYLTCDAGAFIEIIAEGDPNGPIEGPVLGIAHLDATRCYPTGNVEYPVVWNDPTDGKWHRLHTTRVARMVDMPSPSARSRGYGFCAVSRVLASSNFLTLLTGKYKPQKLSDAPPPGLLVLENLNVKQWDELKRTYEHDRRNRGADTWSGIMTLFSVDPTKPADAHMVEFAGLPDWFQFETEVSTYVNIVALALGVDPQDIWPLSSGNLGTGAQSEILHLKAKGKGVGHLLKELIRLINRYVLPDYLEFEIGGQDVEDDKAKAELDRVYIDNVHRLVQLGFPAKRGLEKLVELEVLDAEDLAAVEEAEHIADDTSSEPETVGGASATVEQQPQQGAPGQAQSGNQPPGTSGGQFKPGQGKPGQGKPEGDEGKQGATPDAKKAATVKQSAAFQDIASTYYDTLRGYVDDALSGRLAKGAFIGACEGAISRAFTGAFLAGLAAGGANLTIAELDAEDREVLTQEVDNEKAYLRNGLATDLYNAVRDAAGSDEGIEAIRAHYAARLQLWINRLAAIYEAGLLLANGNEKVKWVLGAMEHCDSCRALAGQVHKARDYVKAGCVPKSHNLGCGGWKCGCSLEPTNEPVNGSLASVPLYGYSGSSANRRPRRGGFFAAISQRLQTQGRGRSGRPLLERE